MALFKKKVDPISDRARALTAEIAAIELRIQKLDAQVNQPQSHPKLRPAAMPHRNQAVSSRCDDRAAQRAVPTAEPVFEEVDQNKLKAKNETSTTPNHYNDLGVRKYDLHSFIQRIKNHFNPPPPANPQLLNYLAAGSFQGLRPLRYEKRVARNRFIALVTLFFLLLLGILVIFVKNH